ncbi:iron ABC transporter permease [Treponema sp. OttesenSCG-928-L16]|nr:iron ABC transporter permease [Treponema sp. OttesenSCG-928-L16]
MTERKYGLFLLILTVLLLCAGSAALVLGSVSMGLKDIREGFSFLFGPSGENGAGAGSSAETAALILFQIRLPRILLAILVGVSLSLSGAAFQGLFRNSLADPYVIGASSGAAFGAAAAMVAGLSIPGPVSALSLCSFAGALGAVFLAFVISRPAGNPPPVLALLLAGTALGTFFSSLLSLMLVLKDRDLHRVYYWLLGSLSGVSWKELLTALPVMAAGWLLIFLCARPLDILLQGEESAESLGVDVRKVRIVTALGASMATAAAVACAGIVGFVGLVAPHTVRLFTGPSHRRLLPASALTGALLVLLADIVSRTAAPPLELPIGIICSLLGVPFFLYLLIRRGRELGQGR